MKDETLKEEQDLVQKAKDLAEQWRIDKEKKKACYSTIRKTWPILIKALQDGHSRNSARKLAHMGDAVFYNYLNDFPEFRELVDEAEALAVDKALQSIQSNLSDPKVAMWFLERKDKSFQAQQRLDVTTNEQAIVFSFDLKELKSEDEGV